jgi:hydrogenase maturation protease
VKVLVAGVGNVFLGDDGFGVEVVRRLAGAPMPDGVRVADYGIRGVHLAYELMNGYDELILVDTVQRGEPPGTIYALQPESGAAAASPMDAHDMTPEAVLGVLESLGGRLSRVVVVGCEPADLDEGMGLSPPVAGAVDDAVRLVHELLDPSDPDLTELDASKPDPSKKGGDRC